MINKKSFFCKKTGILSGLLVGALAITGIKVGYAVSFDSNGFPNTDFRTNVTENVNTKNYVCDLVTCSNSGSGNLIASDFEVRVIGIGGSSNPVVPLYVTSKNMIKTDDESQQKIGFPTSSELIEIGNDTGNPSNVTDNGLKYILRYGYNGRNNGRSIFDKLKNTSGYGEINGSDAAEKKYYITQMAIWLYLNEKSSSFSNYCSSNRCSFTTTASVLNSTFTTSSNKQIIRYIKKLVDDAKSYNGNSTGNAYTYSASNKYELSSDGKTLFYGPIEIKNIDEEKFIKWSATINSAGNTYGMYFVDSNGNKITNLDSLPTYIKIAVSLYDTNGNFKQDMNLNSAGATFTFTIFDDKSTDVIVKDYRVTSTDRESNIVKPEGGNKVDVFSKVLMGINSNSTTSQAVSLTNITVVEKVITGTKEKLAGAELSLYNSGDIEIVDGNAKPKTGAQAIASWISEANKGKEFNLEAGDYYVCEETAPRGYKDLPAGCVRFTVQSDAVTLYALENTPAPDTGFFKSYTPYVIGGILVLLGSTGFIIVNIKKKKESI